MEQAVLTAKFSWPKLLLAVAPVLVAFVTAYGASQLMQGHRDERLTNVETKQTKVENNQEKFMEKFMTKEEQVRANEALFRELESIHKDVREIREHTWKQR
jgi:hypothetical protein